MSPSMALLRAAAARAACAASRVAGMAGRGKCSVPKMPQSLMQVGGENKWDIKGLYCRGIFF